MTNVREQHRRIYIRQRLAMIEKERSALVTTLKDRKKPENKQDLARIVFARARRDELRKEAQSLRQERQRLTLKP